MSLHKLSSRKNYIPLLRPSQPSVKDFWPLYKESLDAHRLANHGPNFMKAQELIFERTTYNTIVSNATVGLELALVARFKPGARILIPSFTFKATYLAVKNAGMVPVVCAVDECSWALSPKSIYGVDGAIVVAPFGHTIDFSRYDGLPIPIVYDLAGAWGLDYKGTNVAVYSGHATKNLCVGECGIIVSKDSFLIREIERLSNFGRTNAKISELQCAMLRALLIANKSIDIGTYYSYKSRFSSFTRTSELPAPHCSLLTLSFTQRMLYDLTTNDVFEAKRYYFPLIEDMYDCQVVCKTPENHPTRTVVALPRDVTDEECYRVIQNVQNFHQRL